jgi:hypothetical protein
MRYLLVCGLPHVRGFLRNFSLPESWMLGDCDRGENSILSGSERLDIFPPGFLAWSRPDLNTVFEVGLVGDERRWRIQAGKALRQ